jgi:heme o synthase
VVRGEEETRFQIVLYTFLLVAVTILPFAGGLFGVVYFISAVVLGSGFIWLAVTLFRARERRPALRLYLSSLAYLALLFSAMVVDVHV